MNSRFRLPTAVGAALLLLGSATFAQSRRVAFSFQGGGAGHEENNLHVGLATGFAMTVPLTARLAVTAEIDHWTTASRSSFRKLRDGRLALTPFLLGLRYEFGGDGYFVPYAVAGTGYLGTKFRISPAVALPEVTIEQNVRSGWAGYFGFGASWRLAALWEFFSEIDYLIRTAPCRTVVRNLNLGAVAEDIWVNLHVVYWKFGVRILF
jgi:opacity protein-like surface antigen